MNLRISFVIFAVSLIGHCSSAVIDVVSPPDLLNVELKEAIEPSPVLPDIIAVAEAEIPKAVLESDVAPQVVQVVETAKESIPEVPLTDTEESLSKIVSEPLTSAIPSVVVPEGAVVDGLDVSPVKISVKPDLVAVLTEEPVLKETVVDPEAIKENVPTLVEGDILLKEDKPVVVEEPLINVFKKEVDAINDEVSGVDKKSVPVAEGISESVSSVAETPSVPVSALLVETKTPVESVLELKKESALPVSVEVKDSDVTVDVPVSPPVTVSSPPEIVSVLSNTFEKTLYPVDISKNIYRTDKDVLVKLELIQRSSVQSDEKIQWIKVAPLPYPPRSMVGGGGLRASHTNAKFTPVPVSTGQMPLSSKTVRVSRKLRYFNPRSRFAMSPALEQEYLAPAVPQAPGCPNENGRCFWPFAYCAYDIYGEYVCIY